MCDVLIDVVVAPALYLENTVPVLMVDYTTHVTYLKKKKISPCFVLFIYFFSSIQELIFSVEGFKPFGWYLTLIQFGFYSMFGLVELQLTQDKRRR